ncbi:MAG TPA: alpha/beta fold hydrolase [Bacteroidota bacterium]|nr:alpha/beta fold hydrolase [Bacteroidota bacterium]
MLRALRPPALSWAAILICCAFVRGQERRDFFIRVGEGDSLDATSFTPSLPPPPAGYPVLLMVHGFGDTKEARIPSCSIYAQSGYLTIAYTVRGHGRSTGLTGIMSTAERRDLSAVLDFVRHMPLVDSNAVGLIGGSQGGLHALWAAADRLPVRALSADAIIPRWASDMFINGSIRRTFVLLLQAPGVRYTPERDSLWKLLRDDRYTELRDRFSRGRDIDTVLLESAGRPLLEFVKWQDHYFSAGEGVREFLRYRGPKKLYAGTQGHFSDEADSERIFQYSQVTRWFNYYLRSIATGIDTEAAYTFSMSSLPVDTDGAFHWTRRVSPRWPPVPLRMERFYLCPDSVLSVNPPEAVRYRLTLENRYTDTGYRFDQGYIEGFRGSRFQTIIPQQILSWSTDLLDSDLVWNGEPVMHIPARSGQTVFPLHLQIYETDSSGRSYFINRINFTARRWKRNSVGIINAAGIAHAHRFSRGSRIRIVLTNIDVTSRKQLGEYPFVIPLFRNTSVDIISTKRNPSWVEIPCENVPVFRHH